MAGKKAKLAKKRAAFNKATRKGKKGGGKGGSGGKSGNAWRGYVGASNAPLPD